MSEEREAADRGDADDTLDDLLDLETDDQPEEEIEEPSSAEQQPQEPEQRQTTLRTRQMRAMRDRLNQEREDNRRLRASVDQLLIAQRTPQSAPDPYRAAEALRMEQERVATMMPHEQAQYYAQQTEQRVNQQIVRARLEVADQIDRQNFAQLCRDEPAFARLAARVEQELATARGQGSNPTREALANQMLALEVREKSRRDADKQRRSGRAAIARQTTQPGGSRSTAAPEQRRNGRDDDAALDARLRGVTIGDLGW